MTLVPYQDPDVGKVSRTWEIADGRFVSILLPPKPTVDDVEVLEEFLLLLKQELAIVWKYKLRSHSDRQAGQAPF